MLKTIIFAVSFVITSVSSAYADISPSLWNYYKSLSERSVSGCCAGFPGRCIGQAECSPEFVEQWSHRPFVYELHFEDRILLGKSVYSLARHSGDIAKDISRDRVAHGVEGFHYSSMQICDWLNSMFNGVEEAPVAEEFYLVSLFIRDGVVQVKDGSFVPSENIGHVLAAAPGRKRSLKENLGHERLHVRWDEERSFREKARAIWESLAEEKRQKFKEALKGYADNEEFLLEEWAVREVLSGNLNVGK